MIRVLVLGRLGMLGQMVLRVLGSESALEVEGTHRSDPSDPLHLDASEGPAGLRKLLERRGRYDYLVNGIGLIKSRIEDGNAESVRQAVVVNALFPHALADAAKGCGARVLHISTDCVYAGRAPAYDEAAPHDALDAYGKTKSLGEAAHPRALTIRCSIVGPDPIGRRGLLEWFLAQPDGAPVPGYVDHRWNGVTTLQFAQLCRRIILEDRFDTLRRESPIHHFCPNRAVSKCELLQLFAAAFQKRVTVVPTAGPEPVSRVLATRCRGLAQLSARDLEMRTAVEALGEFMASEPAPR